MFTFVSFPVIYEMKFNLSVIALKLLPKVSVYFTTRFFRNPQFAVKNSPLRQFILISVVYFCFLNKASFPVCVVISYCRRPLNYYATITVTANSIAVCSSARLNGSYNSDLGSG
jgi:hypothetical protein